MARSQPQPQVVVIEGATSVADLVESVCQKLELEGSPPVDPAEHILSLVGGEEVASIDDVPAKAKVTIARRVEAWEASEDERGDDEQNPRGTESAPLLGEENDALVAPQLPPRAGATGCAAGKICPASRAMALLTVRRTTQKP